MKKLVSRTIWWQFTKDSKNWLSLSAGKIYLK